MIKKFNEFVSEKFDYTKQINDKPKSFWDSHDFQEGDYVYYCYYDDNNNTCMGQTKINKVWKTKVDPNYTGVGVYYAKQLYINNEKSKIKVLYNNDDHTIYGCKFYPDADDSFDNFGYLCVISSSERWVNEFKSKYGDKLKMHSGKFPLRKSKRYEKNDELLNELVRVVKDFRKTYIK